MQTGELMSAYRSVSVMRVLLEHSVDGNSLNDVKKDHAGSAKTTPFQSTASPGSNFALTVQDGQQLTQLLRGPQQAMVQSGLHSD